MRRALEGARLFGFSRDALHLVYRTLALPRGTPAWMPSFHCGMEVRSAVDAGFTPRFYAIRDDLSIDEDDLAGRLAAKPGPVLVIHYFGAPQPGLARVAARCRSLGVALIEDASHAFLSDGVGAWGDATVWSLYKTCGTADGAALRTHLDVASPPLRAVAWGAQRDGLRRRWRDAPRGRSHEALAEAFEDRVVKARRRIFDGAWRDGRGMSRLSLAVIERLDPEAVIGHRRANYERLAALVTVRGIASLMPSLPPGACPLYLPVLVKDRREVLVRLQRQRVETFVFGLFAHPAMDAGDFPEAAALRDHVLCLPVHHDLAAGDLERVAELVA
jgi:dTDP-4-amino-4,6-dideoxygalactose transaminase